VSADYKNSVNGIKIVNASGTPIIEGEKLKIGETYKIRYKIVNDGDFNESVNITVSANDQIIDTHKISVKVGKSTTISDVWDTTELSEGEYTITVNASIPEDGNWSNNERTRVIALTTPTPNSSSISILPSNQNVSIGQNFAVDVVVDPRGIAIAGVQFDLTFDPLLVTANSVTEGHLLDQGGASTYFDTGTINNTAGKITNVYGVIITPRASVSTSGTLATISFDSTTNGTTNIELANVIVGDPNSKPVSVIINNGTVTILQRSIMVNVSPNTVPVKSPTLVTVNTNAGVNVVVNLEGAGVSMINTTNANGIATFVVNATLIGSINVTASKTGYQNGTAIITTFLIGDVNGDRIVDVLDLTIVGQCFGQTVECNVASDVIGDGIINVLDLVAIGQHFGMTA